MVGLEPGVERAGPKCSSQAGPKYSKQRWRCMYYHVTLKGALLIFFFCPGGELIRGRWNKRRILQGAIFESVQICQTHSFPHSCQKYTHSHSKDPPDKVGSMYIKTNQGNYFVFCPCAKWQPWSKLAAPKQIMAPLSIINFS